VPIYKSGRKDDTNNYRGISISSCLGKLFTSILNRRISSFLEENEILKADGTPYTVYTPYKKRWLAKISAADTSPLPSEKLLEHCSPSLRQLPSLESLGFRQNSVPSPSPVLNEKTVREYDLKRDFPAVEGCSKMSLHLRFGTVSIRKLVVKAMTLNDTWLSELIWRDFFMMILYHFPRTVNEEFKLKYKGIQWRRKPEDFQRWCRGKTGYPLVDAGMRQLKETGFMHNRVRMITASFLVKHLLIDWRLGERYFAEKLLDFDLAANVGNWQWAAGCGCDAAPYFRIFNPESQQKKFDKDEEYIRKWIPEYGTVQYPFPMVEHKQARERALREYGLAVK